MVETKLQKNLISKSKEQGLVQADTYSKENHYENITLIKIVLWCSGCGYTLF